MIAEDPAAAVAAAQLAVDEAVAFLALQTPGTPEAAAAQQALAEAQAALEAAQLIALDPEAAVAAAEQAVWAAGS